METGREGIIPIGEKYIKIYDKTKNRRIKKKQIKKAPIIKVRNEIRKYIRNVKKDDIKIYIGDKEIKKRSD